MPRKAVVRPAIIKVLEKANKPLRFTMLRSEVEKLLTRDRLDDKQLDYNLKVMLERGLIRKTVYERKLAYSLTDSYYEEDLRKALVDVLNEIEPSEVLDNLKDEVHPPHIVVIAPPAYDYENKKPIWKIDSYPEPGLYGGGPMKRVGDFRYTSEWGTPSSAIASVVLNDFTGLLYVKERRAVAELLRWAYWIGCRALIKGEVEQSFSIPQLLKKNKLFALQCMKEFKEDPTRVEAEQTLIEILDLTEEIVNKKNLAEFLSYLYENLDTYRILLKKLISLAGEPVNGGERIFEHFTDFHGKVVLGLLKAGLLIDGIPLHLRPRQEQIFLTSSKVWDDVIESIMIKQSLFAYANLEEDMELRKICGSAKEAKTQLRKLGRHLKALLDLPAKRQIAMIYLWGFPKILDLSKKSFIPLFEDWMGALKKGYLDHRRWIFEDGVKAVSRALRAIKRSRIPPQGIIDLQPWTIRDIWEFYPHGKDPEFWAGLLNLLYTRVDKLREESVDK